MRDGLMGVIPQKNCKANFRMKKVFKFGGASVKDAAGVKQVASILKKHGTDCVVVVISAMGKTTNALEKVVDAYLDGDEGRYALLEEIKQAHFSVMKELFPANDPVFNEISNQFVEIEWALEDEPRNDFGYTYDQIVSVGELLSTRIVSAFLTQEGVENTWLDARDIIKTDNSYRKAKVDWALTQEALDAQVKEGVLYVSQGFIGCTSENFTTTLGREGSDYSGAIFASCLGAKQLSIWKDVPGVLNADPRFFQETTLINEMPFKEAIELAYYGAKVLHPKTIQPLLKNNITLEVRSFIEPDNLGTNVSNERALNVSVPSYIVKQNQTLISLDSPDLDFIQEEGLSAIFACFAKHGIAINLMQHSAISFSACFDAAPRKMEALLADFKQQFTVRYNEGLTLYTVRHYSVNCESKLSEGKEVLLEQRSRQTLQLLMR